MNSIDGLNNNINLSAIGINHRTPNLANTFDNKEEMPKLRPQELQAQEEMQKMRRAFEKLASRSFYLIL